MDPALFSDDAEVSWQAGWESHQRAFQACLRKSQLRKRWLDVQDHIFDPRITPERKAKIQRILDKLDRMIAAIPD